MLRRALLLPLFIGVLALLSSCRSAQKMVERGSYDEAVDFCVDKLQGKRKKKDKYVQGLEVAFRKATERDMRRADQLTAADRSENWERIHDIYRNIRIRQEKIHPLLPLTSEDGYQAKFLFVNVENLENESREKAAEYLYRLAESKLVQARLGDKGAGREAWRTLGDLERRYYRNYKNKDNMMREARDLGTTRIVVEVGDKSERFAPRAFFERLLSFRTADLNDEWKAFYLRDELPGGREADYRVVFNLRQVDISPERVHEREYIDEKEVEDGWEYVLDERGNVRKDTSGNDVKRKRYVLTRAKVLEAFQSKIARLSGTIEIFDAARGTRLDIREVGTEIVFEHYASTFSGDARALCDQSRARIGNRPVPFPHDTDMLAQAAERLKPAIRDELKHNRTLQL